MHTYSYYFPLSLLLSLSTGNRGFSARIDFFDIRTVRVGGLAARSRRTACSWVEDLIGVLGHNHTGRSSGLPCRMPDVCSDHTTWSCEPYVNDVIPYITNLLACEAFFRQHCHGNCCRQNDRADYYRKKRMFRLCVLLATTGVCISTYNVYSFLCILME